MELSIQRYKKRCKSRYKTDNKVQRNYEIMVNLIEHKFKPCKPRVQKPVLEGRTKVKDKMRDVTVDIKVDCAR